jgi:RimJ/RimL family protein N-acetyltransferase
MFDYQPHLTGDRVYMRPTAAEDRAALYAIAADPAVWALHPRSDRWREDVFAAYFADGLTSGGSLTALSRETREVIGWSRYSSLFTRPGEIEIGWTFLGRAWWGGAFNADMKRVMLAHAFRFVDRVILRIGPNNLRSRRAAEKIGAVLTDRTEGEGALLNLFYAIDKTLETTPA